MCRDTERSERCQAQHTCSAQHTNSARRSVTHTRDAPMQRTSRTKTVHTTHVLSLLTFLDHHIGRRVCQWLDDAGPAFPKAERGQKTVQLWVELPKTVTDNTAQTWCVTTCYYATRPREKTLPRRVVLFFCVSAATQESTFALAAATTGNSLVPVLHEKQKWSLKCPLFVFHYVQFVLARNVRYHGSRRVTKTEACTMPHRKKNSVRSSRENCSLRQGSFGASGRTKRE